MCMHEYIGEGGGGIFVIPLSRTYVCRELLVRLDLCASHVGVGKASHVRGRFPQLITIQGQVQIS